MKFEIGSKGIELSFTVIVLDVIFLSVMMIIVAALYLHFFDIKGTVDEATVDRHAYTFVNALLSSDQLIYGNQYENFRGMLDKEKIDKVAANPKIIFDKLTYPASTVFVVIQDVDSNAKWTFSGTGPESPVPMQDKEQSYQITVPTAIRYSNNEIHAGLLTFKLTEKLIA